MQIASNQLADQLQQATDMTVMPDIPGKSHCDYGEKVGTCFRIILLGVWEI